MKKSNKIQFNKDFFVGTAFSGTQTESGFNLDHKSESVWDLWYRTEPNKFFNQMNVVNNARLDYKKQIAKAEELSINSMRTSIQWTRLIPDGENVSEEAVKYYRNYFEEIKSKGIDLFVNLFHFDTPAWLYEKGGFETKEAIVKYTIYAKKAFELFGDIVDKWFTFNEPLVPVEMGYLNTFHLPGKIDVKKAMQSMHNYLMSHLFAVREFKKLNLKTEIGIILNITPVIPRSNSKEDLEAKEFADIFFYDCFLSPIYKGKYPDKLIEHAKVNGYMWEQTEEEIELINSKIGIDILGLNYYQPRRVQAAHNKEFVLDKPIEGQLFDNYKYPDAIINKHRGWEIYPKGIYDMLISIKENYNNPKVFIAENGIGVENESKFEKNGMIQDDYRIDFFKEHLKEVNKAISEGSNCVGYHIWTFIDNWSWLNAYKNRYGVISLDIKSGKLSNKLSFDWFKNFAIERGFDE